jgi:outer membrane receptor protein involved in Fe transport
MQGNYITEFEKTVTPASPTSDALNILYGPVDLRLRAGITWSREAVSTTLFTNYRDSYRVSHEADSARISSWTTFDLYLRYQLAIGEPLDGLSLALSVQNLFDEDPPYVEIPPGVNANPGYDPTNADPLGRLVALQLTKAW